LDIKLPSLESKTTSGKSNTSTGPESSVPGTIPSDNGTTSKTISTVGRQVSTTGRVFFEVETALYSCSASVINSKSNDLISTAGHCVYDTTKKMWYNNNNWIFIPAYSDDNRPHGTWPARRFIVLQAWSQSTDYNYDMAFVALSTLNERHIQAVVGSQGIGFNQPRLTYTYSFGYPAHLDSGRFLKSCSGYTQKSHYTQNNYAGQGLSCTMGGGCSGGPWLQNVVEATGVGIVTSVNSFTITTIPNVMNGPYFDSNTKSLYDQATSM
jgi:V8-like Glu-specific endopeptidase